MSPTTSNHRASVWWLVGAIATVVAITVAHYWTDTRNVSLHNVYRRLSYIPIVVAAFSHGLRGGLLTSVAACAAYFPHAFFAHHRDPSPTVDKVFEMVLYVLIGGLTGWLVRRRQLAHLALQRSIEERDSLEAQLVRAGKMSALGQMTAGLAHEIRNPLASIMGSAEALVSGLDASDRRHRLGDLLLREIDRLNRVVAEFVRFARPTPPEREPVELARLAGDVADLSRAEASKHGVDVVVEANGAPSAEGDADQLRQVLLNVLLNAYQAFDQEGARSRGRRVRIRHERRTVAGTDYVGLGVEDNGPGIPPELREEIFNPYFSTRPDGAGLGLAVSSRIVDAHGGFMAIESEDAVTTVWFFLPRASHVDEPTSTTGRG